MIKAYKCALLGEQIEAVLKLLEDSENEVEIQLLSIEDDLSLIDCFQGRVSSIHLPIEKEDRTCNLTTVIKACKEQNGKYYFLNKVAAYATRENAGIVIHANVPVENFCKMQGYKEFIEWVKQYNVKIFLENTMEITDARKSILTPVLAKDRINSELKEKLCFPLLDICHFQVSYNQYNSNLRRNLSEVLSLYAYDLMRIHLCSVIGNGNDRKGGVHGSNFKENLELLEEILKDVYKWNPILILEENESDMINKPNAVWLNNKIDEIVLKQNYKYKTI